MTSSREALEHVTWRAVRIVVAEFGHTVPFPIARIGERNKDRRHVSASAEKTDVPCADGNEDGSEERSDWRHASASADETEPRVSCADGNADGSEESTDRQHASASADEAEVPYADGNADGREESSELVHETEGTCTDGNGKGSEESSDSEEEEPLPLLLAWSAHDASLVMVPAAWTVVSGGLGGCVCMCVRARACVRV